MLLSAQFSKPKGHVLLMEVKDVVIPSPAPEGSQFAFEVQLKSSSWILSASTDVSVWMQLLILLFDHRTSEENGWKHCYLVVRLE